METSFPFLVILRSDIAPESLAALAPILHTFQMGGASVPVLHCEIADESHPHYITLNAQHKGLSNSFATIRFPYWAIFAIVGSKELPASRIGFLSELNHG